MIVSIGPYQLQKCSAPPCMGREEIVLPMLVLSPDICPESPPDTRFAHCFNPAFYPNNLKGTLTAGLLAGSHPYTPWVNVADILAGCRDKRWQTDPRINQVLDELGERYAFFLEHSRSPLYDGFIARCRFITPAQLGEFYRGLDVERETAQRVPARQALAAFLQAYGELPDWRSLYGAHVGSAEFRRMFGDDEAHFVGYAVWPECEGVLRAWTRVVYIPK